VLRRVRVTRRQRREKVLDQPAIEVSWFSLTALDRAVARHADAAMGRHVLLSKPGSQPPFLPKQSDVSLSNHLDLLGLEAGTLNHPRRRETVAVRVLLASR
jgi:hypothetical protein